MAGMRLFCRRCALATDDFFFLGLIDFFIFLPWLGWIPVIYASYLKQRNDCTTADILPLLDISLLGLCILFFLNWMLALLFIIFGAKGTIIEPEPRRHVVTLAYIKLIISIFDAAWASLGTVLLFRNFYCDIDGVALVVKVCTIFQWVATIIRLSLVILFFDWKLTRHSKDSVTKLYFTNPIRKGTLKKWNLRLQAFFLLCTTSTEERKQAIKVLSELLSLASCDVDLVASDLLAGLLILRKKSLKMWELEKKALLETAPITTVDGRQLDKFPPDSFEPWMNFPEANHVFKIGMGVYGWYWFVFKNIACGCCILLKHLTCCFSFRKNADIVEGDNCCGCDIAGLRLTSHLLYEDLVFVSFRDNVLELPFFVTYDHASSSIVITVRGTMSMNDVLTDFCASFDNMDDPGCPPGAICHGGMLTAARQIKKKIEDKHILEEALRDKPHYKLVLNGHSLGAAVTSILTILYKHQFPQVRCYAFAPPPTVNKTALQYVERNIFTIFYGNDIVPFMNYMNVHNMLFEIFDILKECNVPKYKIFFTNMDFETDLERAGNDSSVTQEATPHSPNSNGIDSINANGNGNCIRPPVSTENCYLAGTLVHIRRTEDGYRLKISNSDQYNKIVLRPNCLFDHVPIALEKALAYLTKTDTLDSSSLLKSS